MSQAVLESLRDSRKIFLDVTISALSNRIQESGVRIQLGILTEKADE
jgi:hypothetical protein